jgi:hypothetical protein
LQVMGRPRIKQVEVRADGTWLSSRAGTMLLPLAAERLGLTDALGWALAETREGRSAHDPGRVFRDVAVMLADGGRCVSDLVALLSTHLAGAQRVELAVADQRRLSRRSPWTSSRSRWHEGRCSSAPPSHLRSGSDG